MQLAHHHKAQRHSKRSHRARRLRHQQQRWWVRRRRSGHSAESERATPTPISSSVLFTYAFKTTQKIHTIPHTPTDSSIDDIRCPRTLPDCSRGTTRPRRPPCRCALQAPKPTIHHTARGSGAGDLAAVGRERRVSAARVLDSQLLPLIVHASNQAPSKAGSRAADPAPTAPVVAAVREEAAAAAAAAPPAASSTSSDNFFLIDSDSTRPLPAVSAVSAAAAAAALAASQKRKQQKARRAATTDAPPAVDRSRALVVVMHGGWAGVGVGALAAGGGDCRLSSCTPSFDPRKMHISHHTSRHPAQASAPTTPGCGRRSSSCRRRGTRCVISSLHHPSYQPGQLACASRVGQHSHPHSYARTPTKQISVRCTFDAGDADAFVAEALRLHDHSGRRALTIVAAGAKNNRSMLVHHSVALDTFLFNPRPLLKHLPLMHAPANEETSIHPLINPFSSSGGDGTVNEVACALLKHGAPLGVGLGVLPLGTANDLASALGISMVRRTVGFLMLGASCAGVCVLAGLVLFGAVSALRYTLCMPTSAHAPRHPHPSKHRQDPAAALRLALNPSAARPVDVGLVNGHAFVNVALVRAGWGGGRLDHLSAVPVVLSFCLGSKPHACTHPPTQLPTNQSQPAGRRAASRQCPRTSAPAP